MIRVLWKVKRLDLSLASVRYRCLAPCLALARTGSATNTEVRSALAERREIPADLSDFDAVVLVKDYSDDGMRLAEAARVASVPVVLDVCDNPESKGDTAVAGFEAIAPLLSRVVTTGPAMAEIVRRHGVGGERIAQIPDPAISRADVEAYPRVLVSSRYRGPLTSRRDGLRRLLRGALPGRAASLASRSPVGPGRSEPGVAEVVWFGAARSKKGASGIESLARICPELEKVHTAQPLRLTVVSDDERLFRERIAPRSFASRFVGWDLLGSFAWIAGADVCVVPVVDDEFNAPKSTNRALLALAQGVPVVASRLPNYEPLADCVAFDDFEAGVLGYLTDAELRRTHLARADRVIAEQFSDEAIAGLWRRTLAPLCAERRA